MPRNDATPALGTFPPMPFTLSSSGKALDTHGLAWPVLNQRRRKLDQPYEECACSVRPGLLQFDYSVAA
jgi:hypothetical protein